MRHQVPTQQETGTPKRQAADEFICLVGNCNHSPDPERRISPCPALNALDATVRLGIPLPEGNSRFQGHPRLTLTSIAVPFSHVNIAAGLRHLAGMTISAVWISRGALR